MIVPISKKQFGDRVAELMAERNLTQSALGESMKLSISRVNDWIHGRSMPRFNTAVLLAHALGVGVADLTKPAKRKQKFKVGRPSGAVN